MRWPIPIQTRQLPYMDQKFISKKEKKIKGSTHDFPCFITSEINLAILDRQDLVALHMLRWMDGWRDQ
jgi:hypothetical protein